MLKDGACGFDSGVGALLVLQDLSEVYLAPSLKLGREHLQPLLDEAADVQRRLEALGS